MAMATCGATAPVIGSVGVGEWCTLAPEHLGPHTNSTGVRWKNVYGLDHPPNLAAPQVHRVDRCANLTCSNRPGEGTFTVFAVPKVVLAFCAPCAEKMKAVWPG